MRKKIQKNSKLESLKVNTLTETNNIKGGKGAPVDCGTRSNIYSVDGCDGDLVYHRGDWSDEGCC